MPGRWVAVEVDARRILHHALASQQPRRHVGQVSGQAAAGRDIATRSEGEQALQLLVERRVSRGDIIQGLVLRSRPDPGILKDVGLRLAAEGNVVIALGIEGRIEVDEVDRGRLDVTRQDIEAITVIERAGRLCLGRRKIRGGVEGMERMIPSAVDLR